MHFISEKPQEEGIARCKEWSPVSYVPGSLSKMRKEN